MFKLMTKASTSLVSSPFWIHLYCWWGDQNCKLWPRWSPRIVLWHSYISKTCFPLQSLGLEPVSQFCKFTSGLCHVVTSFSLAGFYARLHTCCSCVICNCRSTWIALSLGLKNWAYTIPFSSPYPTKSAYWPAKLATLQCSGEEGSSSRQDKFVDSQAYFHHLQNNFFSDEEHQH